MGESWGVLAIINGAAVCYHALGTHARWARALGLLLNGFAYTVSMWHLGMQAAT